MNKPPIETVNHHFAGIFLVTEDKKVVGQRRDNKPSIDNPGKVGTFGGTVEANEDAKKAVWRELTQEETNLDIDLDQIHELSVDVEWREFTKEWEVRHFYYAFVNNSYIENMQVYEGQGWAYIKNPDDAELIELWRKPVKQLFDKLNLPK